MAEENDLESDIAHVIMAVGRQGDGSRVAPEVLERTVRECFAELQDARVKGFVGLFAERSAKERLRRLTETSYQEDREAG